VRLQLAARIPVDPVLASLVELARGLPAVLEQPTPQGLVVELNATGPMVALRFHCNVGDYTQVQSEAFRRVALRADQEGWLVTPPLHAANDPYRDKNRKAEPAPLARIGS
jgi:hypothetical protein